MCWNLEVSLLTGCYSWIISIYAIKRGHKYDKWFALILMTFSSIQFADSLLWLDNEEKSELNYLVTKYLIPFLLALQPLAVLCGASIHNIIGTDEIIIYLTSSLMIFLFLSPNMDYTSKSHNGLHWAKDTSVYENILCGVIFCILTLYPIYIYLDNIKLRFFIYSIIIFSLLLSYTSPNWGSKWCLYANIISIGLLFYPFFIK